MNGAYDNQELCAAILSYPFRLSSGVRGWGGRVFRATIPLTFFLGGWVRLDVGNGSV